MLNDHVSSRLRKNNRELIIYIKSIFFSGLAIGIVVFVQLGLILKTFEPYYLIVPVILAVVLGFLFGHVAILRKHLLLKNHLFRAVADFAQEFTYFRRLDGSYEYVSPSCIDMTGYSTDEFYNNPNLMDQLIHSADKERWLSHINNINDEGQAESMDLRLVTKDGSTIWFNHICGPVFNDAGERIGVRSTNVNISERKLIEQRIQHMAYYDPLTDLPNRRSLSKYIDELTQASDPDSEKFAILFLDLDRFKNINDSFHHEFGDHLLAELAKRLQQCCRDRGFVTRFGGDEFVVVVPNLGDPTTAINYAQEMIDLIEQPFVINEKELYISGGVGIALYPYDGLDATTLIRNADAAMYQAKKEAHTCISLSSKELIDDATTFITTENRIRQGLANKEFISYFQPKVNMANGNIIGVEALARWNSEGQGIIQPDEFIYIAEETGLIISLGAHILEIACEQINNWSKKDIILPVAVNISSKQFAHPKFIETVSDVINKYGIQPRLLEFEITEQVFLNDINSAIDTLWRLKDIGITIAVDDFGTGYSSLNYIKRLPIDTLKIDKAFAKDILNDARDVAILKAILSLCDDLKLKTVVEGVETQEQAKLLSQLGCTTAQGFLYYEAMPAEQLTSVIRQKSAEI